MQENADAVVVGTLRREDGGAERLLTSFAEAYVKGVGVDWAGILGGGTVVDLPTYAFEHRHYWPQTPHPVLGRVSEGDAEFWAAVEGGDLDELAAALN
ncbi:hypothetical protein, partial [Streptomyces lonarensis]|uniref:hypothetical protein n=1 Tax=Streptomyces lonarensis TaxID=700599 RepID=UPI0030C74906